MEAGFGRTTGKVRVIYSEQILHADGCMHIPIVHGSDYGEDDRPVNVVRVQDTKYR